MPRENLKGEACNSRGAQVCCQWVLKSSEVKSASQDILKRTQAFIDADGGVLEHRLWQYKNFAVEE